MSEMEVQRISGKYRLQLNPDFRCGDLEYYEFCMFLGKDNRCVVYEERPIRCRLFGCTDEKDSIYKCPHGCQPEAPWTEEELQEVLKEYQNLVDGQNEYVTFGLFNGQLRPITRGKNG